MYMVLKETGVKVTPKREVKSLNNTMIMHNTHKYYMRNNIKIMQII